LHNSHDKILCVGIIDIKNKQERVMKKIIKKSALIFGLLLCVNTVQSIPSMTFLKNGVFCYMEAGQDMLEKCFNLLPNRSVKQTVAYDGGEMTITFPEGAFQNPPCLFIRIDPVSTGKAQLALTPEIICLTPTSVTFAISMTTKEGSGFHVKRCGFAQQLAVTITAVDTFE